MDKDKLNQRFSKHPIITNLLIIVIVAFLGLWIIYVATALFTRHGEEQVVPKVENMSYTKAVELLHSYGLNVEIRDSLFRDDVKPGFVIEQFPKANSVVKPGRKVFLYINAVHPKEVIIDDNHDRSRLALKGVPFRTGLARLRELGFKEIETMVVLGDNDNIVKILANGKPVYQMQKVPVNAKMTIVISDNRLGIVRDSIFAVVRNGVIIEDFNFDNYAPSYNSSEAEESEPTTEYFEMPTDEPSTGGAGSQESESSTDFF